IKEYNKNYPQGEWGNKNIFIYDVSPSINSGYSYFIEHNGLIYEILIGTDIYSEIARMAFSYVLQQLEPARLNAYPSENTAL
uniref:hypothetical protein n=1 Tax=Xenorhabdus sp. PB30.3 TaxID=2788941 RepID=UPI001E29687E